MSDVKPRRYDAPRRRERARATRARIVAAARELFHGGGYGATTMEEIAGRAGVSVQTVYATFGTKRAILEAMAVGVTDAADVPRLVAQTTATSDPRRQLAAAVEFQWRLWSHGADIPEIVRGAAATDPGLMEIYRRGELRRRTEQAQMVRSWAGARALRPGLAFEAAADLLWTLTSPDIYRLLITECGWTGEQFRSWLYETLAVSLFGKS